MIINELKARKEELESDIAEVVTKFYRSFGHCDVKIDVGKFVPVTSMNKDSFSAGPVEAIVNVTLEI